ncbi:MAG: hypothetical protein V4787_18565 [Pseudomonadota bacterium]
MAVDNELSAGGVVRPASGATTTWLLSWPLLAGAFAYLYALYQGKELLLDGDTYWHVTTGQWVLRHGSVPDVDPFSHTMPGIPWTAHEWLSDVVLAGAHDWGGWAMVVAVTGVAFALTIGLLTRALLKWLEPIYALLFAGLALGMTSGHLLARPHIIAMPILMLWTIELVRASEARRAPAWWMLPLMTVWANLHGGFTLGIALAGAVALEAVLDSDPERRMATVKSWGVFILLAVASSLVTPHGAQGPLYTLHVLNLGFVLERVGEWRSPSFSTFNTFELWLLGGIALVAYQGLRLPPMRLLLVVGLLHLALKHVRYVELVGLLAPLFFAGPFGAQWAARRQGKGQGEVEALDRFFQRLAEPASRFAVLGSCLALILASALNARMRPLELPETIAPAAALDAVHKAGIKGRVLNSYSSGGYLIYRGIPVFIDGRSDMYGEQFMKAYVYAMEQRTPGGLEKLLAQYDIGWTLLEPENSTTAVLDRLPGWKRLYADKVAVVHVRAEQAKEMNP